MQMSLSSEICSWSQEISAETSTVVYLTVAKMAPTIPNHFIAFESFK